jgi:hypothetical protein
MLTVVSDVLVDDAPADVELDDDPEPPQATATRARAETAARVAGTRDLIERTSGE